MNPKFDQPKFGCRFLLKYDIDNHAVTAKHLLKIIKSNNMNYKTIGNRILLKEIIVS